MHKNYPVLDYSTQRTRVVTQTESCGVHWITYFLCGIYFYSLMLIPKNPQER